VERVSFSTRPPGDVTRPGALPPSPTPAPSGPAPAMPPIPGAGTPAAAAGLPAMPRGSTLDVNGALRVLFEEIRTAAQAQLTSATNSASPALTDAEPGNAAAAILRWLRAASADSRVPPAVVRQIVETAHERTQAVLRSTVAAAARGAAPAAGGPGGIPGSTSVGGLPGGAAAGAAVEPDLPPAVREALAYTRERVLLGLPADTRGAASTRASTSEPRAATAAARPAAGPADPSARAAASSAAARAMPAPDDLALPPEPLAPARLAETRPTPAPGGSSAVADAVRGSLSTGSHELVDAALPAAVPSRPTAPAASTAPRAPADATALLRALVDEVRAELQRTVGAARLPSGPAPLVTDPHGTTLGPALLRWLTGAVAEKGVPLAPLQDAVRNAHARVEAGSAAAVASPSPATARAQDPVQETLRSVRDFVLRGLGAAPDRVDAAPARADAPPRADVRLDPPIVDPRGIPLPSGGALVPRDDRVEAIGARAPARRDESDAAIDDEVPPEGEAARGESELQGPLDCIRRYFDAFLAGDSLAYAEQWVYPACVWKDGRWSAYANASACARGNDEYTFAVRAQGAVGGRIVMLRAEPVSEDVAIVHGVFTRERADGRVLQEVEAAYTTVRTADGWRVAVCIVK
jgi:hypothetical protein